MRSSLPTIGLLSLVSAVACMVGPPTDASVDAWVAPPTTVAVTPAEPTVAHPLPALPELAIDENLRDPFVMYNETTVGPPPGPDDAMAHTYSLNDLHLVAVVADAHSPRAMVVTPDHQGLTLRLGTVVGRQEVLHATDGYAYYAHWRVARIETSHLARHPDGTMFDVPARVVFELQDPVNAQAAVRERAVSLEYGGWRLRRTRHVGA